MSFAYPVDELDPGVLAQHAASFTGRPSSALPGGNQQLAIRLAARLSRQVHLDTPVTGIDWSSTEAPITTAAGAHVADRCVIAVPAAVWRRISFTPVLLDWKVHALDNVDYGHAAKLDVPSVLNCFAGSASALQRLDAAQGPRSWLSRIHQLYPEFALDNQSAVLTTWDDDPWTQAAYSTRRATAHSDVIALQAAVGSLHFAGDHTAGDSFGLIEGAIRSGQNAARTTCDQARPVNLTEG